MKNVLFCFLIAITLLYSSCKKEYTLSSDVNVSIDGYVYDIKDNKPVTGVVVSGSFGEATTDESGHYKIDGLNPGMYMLTFTAEGYGSIIDTVSASPNGFGGETYIVNSIVSLTKTDQELNTQLFIYLGGKYSIAAGAAYTIELPSNYVPKLVEGITDSEGKIAQKNLPNISVKLKATLTKDGKKYMLYNCGDYYCNDYVKGFPSTFASACLLSIIKEDIFLLVETNIIDSDGKPVKNFTATDNIMLQFSTPVDTLATTNHFKLYKKIDYSSYPVASTYKFSQDGKTVTINPLGDYLSSGAQYYIDVYATSKNNNYFSNNLSFTVAGNASSVQLGKVETLIKTYPTTITPTTYYVNISFSAVTNASNYMVYGKYGNEYLYLRSIYSSSSSTISSYLYLDDLPGIVVPSGGLFSNGAEYSIIVRAETNSGTVGEFSDPLVLKAN